MTSNFKAFFERIKAADFVAVSSLIDYLNDHPEEFTLYQRDRFSEFYGRLITSPDHTSFAKFKQRVEALFWNHLYTIDECSQRIISGLASDAVTSSVLVSDRQVLPANAMTINEAREYTSEPISFQSAVTHTPMSLPWPRPADALYPALYRDFSYYSDVIVPECPVEGDSWLFTRIVINGTDYFAGWILGDGQIEEAFARRGEWSQYNDELYYRGPTGRIELHRLRY